jgi:hypothetical protein
MGMSGNAAELEVLLVPRFIVIVCRLVTDRGNFTLFEYDWLN